MTQKLNQAYQGAIHAIQQKENPDRLTHFAYSLRDVIDLLARSKQTEEERGKSLSKTEKKDFTSVP